MTDADNLIDRARAELGDPDADYRVGPARVRAKLGLVVLLTVGGAAANYLWWVHGPGKFDAILAKILIAPPVIGVGLLWHLFRTRGLHVLLYPTGLLRVQRGEVESYPWAEVAEVRLKADKATVEVVRGDDGGVASCWLAVEEPTFQLWAAALTVARADGASARLTPAVTGYADLVERVQLATFALRWPTARATYRAGKPVTFGPVEAGWGGLKFEKGLLPWADIGEVSVSGKTLWVKRTGKWMPWASVALEQVPNPHVLLALVEEARQAARPDPAPATDGEAGV